MLLKVVGNGVSSPCFSVILLGVLSKLIGELSRVCNLVEGFMVVGEIRSPIFNLLKGVSRKS